MRSPDDRPRFKKVNWGEIDRSASFRSPELVVFLCGAVLLAAAFWYDATMVRGALVGDWFVDPIDWVFLCAVLVIVSFGVVPVVRRRGRARRVLGRVRSRAALFGGVYLSVVVLLGILAPVVSPDPGLQFNHSFHPPVGFATEVPVLDCQGRVTGGAFDRTCHGSMAYPLGTNQRGHPMGYLVTRGARIALFVLAITAAFVVPLAATVGLVAGLRGGLVDDALMGYVDLQLCLPALVVYIVANAYWHTSLLVLLATFGLLSWGGVARLVRSETLQRREAGHVRVARGFGASWRYVARRHVLPNVTNTLLPAAAQLLALLVLVEAGVAFLGFHDVQLRSWGATISDALSAGHPAHEIWWVSTVPAIALVLTVLSLKLVGDGLRDALDPRGGR